MMVAVKSHGKGLSTLLVGVFAMLFCIANPAQACTINASWTQSGGSAALPRYQGECAYQAAALGNTLTHTMGDVSTYTVAFYALTQFNTGSTISNTVTIFRASDNSSPKFEIRVKGDGTADLVVISGSTLNGAINAPAANYNGWNHYKAVWDGNNVSFSINGQSAGSTGMTGALDTQQIGHIASSTPNLAANLAFDHFVSLELDEPAQTSVLCPGDTDANGMRDFNDVLAVYGEYASFGINKASGQADINGDSAVNFSDVQDIYDLYASFQGACSN